MRLRRIVEHLKTQNWTAIFLDFVIVVVGVFVAMQVSDWNDERKDRLNEKVILARLASDFDAILEMEVSRAERTAKSLEATEAFVAMIRSDTVPKEASALEAIFKPMRAEPPPPPPSDTYAQLVANGEMSVIRSSELRLALSQFERIRKQHEVGFQAIADSTIGIGEAFWTAVDLAEIANDTNRQSYAAELSDVVDSPEFGAALNTLRMQQSNNLHYHRLTLEEARRVTSLLSGEGE